MKDKTWIVIGILILILDVGITIIYIYENCCLGAAWFGFLTGWMMIRVMDSIGDL